MYKNFLIRFEYWSCYPAVDNLRKLPCRNTLDKKNPTGISSDEKLLLSLSLLIAMAPSQISLKTNFKPVKVIQPFYTGGKVALDRSGRILVTTLNEDVLITDLETGDELARIEGVSMHAEFRGS